MHPCRGCSTKTSPSKNRQPSRLYKGACRGSQNTSPKSTPCLSRISLTASRMTSLAMPSPRKSSRVATPPTPPRPCIKLSFAQNIFRHGLNRTFDQPAARQRMVECQNLQFDLPFGEGRLGKLLAIPTIKDSPAATPSIVRPYYVLCPHSR
jgi:hypothetical protein